MVCSNDERIRMCGDTLSLRLSLMPVMVRSSVVVFTSFRLGNSVRVLVRLVFTSRELKMKTAARVGTRSDIDWYQ